MNNDSYPIALSKAQEALARQWAADDRLWTTQETVEFNLRVFARAILTAKPDVEVPEIPSGDAIVLTWKLVHDCRTDRGGFTNATLNALGMKKPLKRGWVRMLEGQTITKERYRLALEGRHIYRSRLD